MSTAVERWNSIFLAVAKQIKANASPSIFSFRKSFNRPRGGEAMIELCWKKESQYKYDIFHESQTNANNSMPSRTVYAVRARACVCVWPQI